MIIMKKLIVILFLISPAIAEEKYFKYKTQKGDTLSNILWSLGVDTLYGNTGYLKKYLAESGVDVSKAGFIEVGQIIIIPKEIIRFEHNVQLNDDKEIIIKEKLQTISDATVHTKKKTIYVKKILEKAQAEQKKAQLRQQSPFRLDSLLFLGSIEEQSLNSEATTNLTLLPGIKAFYHSRKYDEELKLSREIISSLRLKLFIGFEEPELSPAFRLKSNYVFSQVKFKGITPYAGAIYDASSVPTFASGNLAAANIAWYGLTAGGILKKGKVTNNLQLAIPIALTSDAYEEEMSFPGFELNYTALYAFPEYKVSALASLEISMFESEDVSLTSNTLFLGFRFNPNEKDY